ncbi:hypothetical protein KBTX_03684 [wastewater metagenome]|uniref:Polysaccharide lyase n=3 Tax=root TaxID=1 RepID=A0A5B8RJQ6_9ZZZZ|nr:hypothetical protein KBTEX_03684 [uncultured organism]
MRAYLFATTSERNPMSKRWIPVIALACAVGTAQGATLFSDGFESGGLNRSEGGISWGYSTSASVSANNAYSGSSSLAFVYDGVGDGSDSFAEQRLELGQAYRELWFGYDLYIPANYSHRSQSGPSNNKFIAIYRDPYTNPGFQVNFSLNADGSGGSTLMAHRYDYGSEAGILSAGSFIDSSDLGRWHKIVVHVKVPSSGSASDGVLQLWKDGEQMADFTGVAMYGGDGQNYFDEAYLLGWANSGFDQRTVFYLDNLVVSDTPLSGDVTAPPEPPTVIDTEVQ